MSILDKVKIGNYVQVNLEVSGDRLTKETIDAINVSSLCKISELLNPINFFIWLVVSFKDIF